ncbi:hypothetical protein [Pseudofrankia sp. BMG5.36]|nr:hypothetical protein [Pseudofrankia sp. BMG5.36]
MASWSGEPTGTPRPGDLPALRAVRATTEAGGLTARTLRSWLC